MKHSTGFTLVELLIALLIVGEIATFTIPKIISSQQNKTNNLKAKEAAGMLSQALQQYRVYNPIVYTTGIGALTPYFNYVKYDNSAAAIDGRHTDTTTTCNTASGVCLRMHNGSTINFWPGDRFGDCTRLHAVPFNIDPDGRVTDGTTNGPGKAVEMYLYCDGKIRDRGNVETGTILTNGHGTYSINPLPSLVPPWFSW